MAIDTDLLIKDPYERIALLDAYSIKDLDMFTEHILGFENGEHHSEWYSILQDELRTPIDGNWDSPLEQQHDKNLLITILAPRSHSKSTAFTVNYPLWEIGRDPNIRILIVSATNTQAIAFLREIKSQMTRNPRYRRVFGDLFPENILQADKWTDTEIIVRRTDASKKDATVAVTSVGGPVLGRRADIIICFPGHTKIETLNGSANIRNIKSGDIVKSHLGDYLKVLDVSKNKYWGRMIQISTKHSTVTATPEHPFYVNGDWIQAQDIKTGYKLHRPNRKSVQYLRFNKSQRSKTLEDREITPELAKWLGLYVADGCVRNKNTVAVCFDSKELDLIKDCDAFMSRFGKTYVDTHNSWSTNVIVYSVVLANRLGELFGLGALNKHIPKLIFDLGDREKASFILGLMSDGHRHESGAYTYSSNSLQLRDDTVKLFQQLSITATSLKTFKEAATGYGGENNHRLYINSIDANKLRQIADDDYTVTEAKETVNHTGYVYNLEVEQDSSYIANGFSVHNCDDILNEKIVKTAEQREKTRDWFNSVLMPVLEPTGRLIVVGCIISNSMILMSSGIWKKIKDIKVGEKVWSVDELTGERKTKMVEAVIPQGKAETLKVSTARHSVTATHNHPFMTIENGKLNWKRADKLKTNDLLVTSKQMPSGYKKRWNGKDFVDNDFCWLFGFLMGDGWVSKGSGYSICFAPGVDEELNDKVCNLFERYFGRRPTKRGNYYRLDSKLGKIIQDLGLNGGAGGKRIPEWVHKSRPSEKRSFIEGMIDADGTKLTKGKGYRVELHNKELVNDLRLLALTCSVRPGSVVHRKRFLQAPNSKQSDWFDCYSVSLVFTHWQTKENKSLAKTQMELLGLRVDKVKSVIKSGEQEVWDLTVQGTRNFIADGLVVHNTAWNVEDLYHETMKQKIYQVRKRYKAITDLDKKKVLWEERWTHEKLMERKQQMGSIAFSKSYQNEAISAEDQIFRPEWLEDAKSYNRKLVRFVNYAKWDLGAMTVTGGLDLAISQKDGSDFTASAVIGRTKTGVKIPLWLSRDKLSPSQTRQLIIELFERYPMMKQLTVENNAYQDALVRDMAEQTDLPIRGYNTGGEKFDEELGINSLAVDFENGKWILPYSEDSEYTQRMVDFLVGGMLNFPSGHTEDLLMALWFSNQAMRDITYGKKKGKATFGKGNPINRKR